MPNAGAVLGPAAAMTPRVRADSLASRMVRAGGSPRKAPALGDQACHGLYSSAARERGRCRGGGRAGRGPLARPAGTEELIPGSHEPARGVPAEDVVSAKSW